jgi:PhoPQ-activated pathogenicity-related protein
MTRRVSRWCSGVPLALLVQIAAVWPQQALGTPLDDYVARPDPNYTWRLRRTVTGSGYKGYVLDMKSQVWRSTSEVNRTLWQHWVIVIVPTTVTTDKAMLIIDGGSNGGSVPSSVDSTMAMIATGLGTVVVDLQQVPNEPLTFAGETQSRTEDAIIAYSWDKYLRTGDPNWPAQLPMTKSAVRGMDTVQAFCRGLSPSVTINKFVVGGASKRGWTTWLTGAVDPRVVAICPIVIDVLNVEKCLLNAYNSYGFFPPAVQDYVDMGIMNWMGTSELTSLMNIVDPYVYRDRFTMPKYLINAAGDQFFFPESSQFYWDDLPGEKHLRYVPNTDHGMSNAEEDVGFALMPYYQSLISGTPRPQFTWTLESDGSIRIQTATAPSLVRMWQAYNPNARDFRLESLGPVWTSSNLSDQGGGVYIAQVPRPAQGFRAFFAELFFDSPTGGSLIPYKFSTQVRILPEPTSLSLQVVNASWGSVQIDPNLPKYYDPNTVVTLTATAIDGKQFNGWQIYDPNYPGDDNYAIVDANSTITLKMDCNREVTAGFKCANQPVLTLVPVGACLLMLRLFRRRG